MEEFTLISRGLYGVVSDIIGPEPIIDIRRTVMQLNRGVNGVIVAFDERVEEEIYSGSMAEGLRFTSSDRDYMFVRRGIRATFSHISNLTLLSQKVLFQAETDFTKPGFTLLRLIHQSDIDQQVTRALIRYGSSSYLSSTLWVTSGESVKIVKDSSVHGPCLTFKLGNIEIDYAECIKAGTLPTPAIKSLLQLYQAEKISHNDLQNICLKGCHFVAIGSKRPVHEGLEWRISFSFAERTISHSFNHTQLLCYGLLKIFLKEAIETKNELKGLLCSYFMKTAVFWLSIDCSVQWAPANFLSCFWKCLNLLMNWIQTEYCPNFFIPENNMIADKFTRGQYSSLLVHFSNLHREGFQCLFRCPSRSDLLRFIIEHPLHTLRLSPLVENPSKSKVECTFISEIWNEKRRVTENRVMEAILQYLESLGCDHLRTSQMGCVYVWNCMFLSELAFRIGSQGIRDRSKTNMLHYRQCKTVVSTLRRCHVDAASHLIYNAIYLYRLGRYIDGLQIIDEAKKKLWHPCLIYPWNLDEEKYATAGGETRPILDMMRAIVAFPLVLYKETSLPELFLEHQAAGRHSIGRILIPPLVCASFLGYLCNYRMGRFQSATAMLIELYNLLHHDDGYHIYKSERAISWEILGICQEMDGDFQGAYRSYYAASQQEWCKIKTAAEIRCYNALLHLI